MGVGSPFLAKFPIMEVLNIWSFLTSTEPVGPFGLTITWFPVLLGETVVIPPIRTGEFSLGGLITRFLSHGVVLSLPVLHTLPGFRKTCALLHAASVTTPFKVGAECACGVLPQVATPSGICGSIFVVLTRMVRLLNDFVANFCW